MLTFVTEGNFELTILLMVFLIFTKVLHSAAKVGASEFLVGAFFSMSIQLVIGYQNIAALLLVITW